MSVKAESFDITVFLLFKKKALSFFPERIQYIVARKMSRLKTQEHENEPETRADAHER